MFQPQLHEKGTLKIPCISFMLAYLITSCESAKNPSGYMSPLFENGNFRWRVSGSRISLWPPSIRLWWRLLDVRSSAPALFTAIHIPETSWFVLDHLHHRVLLFFCAFGNRLLTISDAASASNSPLSWSSSTTGCIRTLRMRIVCPSVRCTRPY